MSELAVESAVVSQIGYEDAIGLLSTAESVKEVGCLTTFKSKTEEGRPVIVIMNQLDSEECVQILL